jgi:hypothetical protein
MENFTEVGVVDVSEDSEKLLVDVLRGRGEGWLKISPYKTRERKKALAEDQVKLQA